MAADGEGAATTVFQLWGWLQWSPVGSAGSCSTRGEGGGCGARQNGEKMTKGGAHLGGVSTATLPLDSDNDGGAPMGRRGDRGAIKWERKG
jgi:hypothetical protein